MESSSTINGEDEESPEKDWPQKASEFLSKVRPNSPLIQSITNLVSMDFMANKLLTAGASPPMVLCAEEISDFTPQVHSLCLNMGTLSAATLPPMKSLSAHHGKPWVLDPVAAGSSGLRACLDLVDLKPTVVRGNRSEIIALSRVSAGIVATKGVDSLNESMDALEAAKSLAQANCCHCCRLWSTGHDNRWEESRWC